MGKKVINGKKERPKKKAEKWGKKVERREK